MARREIPSDPRHADRRVTTRDRAVRVPPCHGHLSFIVVVGGRGAPLAIVNMIAPTLCVVTHHRGENTGDETSPGERAQIAATSAQKHAPV